MAENFWCKWLGHKWRYKNFVNAVDSNGRKLNYKATRKCLRCEKQEYKYAEWVGEEMMPATDKFIF